MKKSHNESEIKKSMEYYDIEEIDDKNFKEEVPEEEDQISRRNKAASLIEDEPQIPSPAEQKKSEILPQLNGNEEQNLFDNNDIPYYDEGFIPLPEEEKSRKSKIPNEYSVYDKKNSIHVYNPVPLSKLQNAENQYYKIKAEIEEKFFGKPSSTNGAVNDIYLTRMNSPGMKEQTIPLPNKESKKQQTKEMLGYLEKLNDVLAQMIENSKISSKSSRAKVIKSKINQTNKTPEEEYNEQVQLQLNNEKFVEVYKKEYNSLQQRLKMISQIDYLPNLENENKNLEQVISGLTAENKKLQNEQKLNEIVISKINKGENKSNVQLKRLVMDFESLKRQAQVVQNKIESKNQLLADNVARIDQLKEFEIKLTDMAREMYGITEFENVKYEEKNEKKMKEKKENLSKKIEIFEKVLKSNKKKYEMEIIKNEKKIMELQMNKEALLETLRKNGGEIDQTFGPLSFKKTQTNSKPSTATIGSKKVKQNLRDEEKKKSLKEMENRQKEKEDMLDVLNQINNTNNEIIKIDNTKPEQSQNHILEPNIAKDETTIVNYKTLDDKQIKADITNGPKDDTTLVNYNNNETILNNKTLDDKTIIESKKEELPQFLEGFVDESPEDIQNPEEDNQEEEKDTYDVNISNKAIIDRKHHIDIMQKESFQDMIKKNLPPHPKDEVNEFENLEEFQI